MNAKQILLISYPKAGRTWLRMILAKLFNGEIVTALHWYIKRARRELNLKSHKIIYLYRDPRDIVVSLYFEWTHRKKKLNCSLSEFVRTPGLIEKPVAHYMEWMDYLKNNKTKGQYMMSYKSLHKDTFGEILGLVKFLGSDVSDSEVKEAIAYSSFDNMRKIEQEGGGILAEAKGHFGKHWKEGDPESFRCRQGKVGGYKKYLSREDIKFCNERLKCTSS